VTLSLQLLGLSVSRIDEFRAIGRGGVFLTGVSRAVVASLGTGTTIVEVDEGKIAHWGGSGLFKALLGVSDIEVIARKAAKGNLDKGNLSVGDISTKVIPGLPPETTAANFTKMADDASHNDLAMAVVNLVCQTVGMIAAGTAVEAGGVGV